MSVKRIFAQKKPEFATEARGMLYDIRHNLRITSVTGLRILNRYDVEGLSGKAFNDAVGIVFSEPPVDDVFFENFSMEADEVAFCVEYLPGQYDQRADFAAQCVQILSLDTIPTITTARVIVLKGSVSEDELKKIKAYIINPVEARETGFEKPETLEREWEIPGKTEVLQGFISLPDSELVTLCDKFSLALSKEDLLFCRDYFRDTEKRDPTITEIRLIDTYWSDHCRHTTFLTKITGITFDDDDTCREIKDEFDNYMALRKELNREHKDINLMDIATIGAKVLAKRGFIPDLDVSEEINACSIKVTADVDGKDEEWLVMFKNETHNHPTEIEPFGGAATCLGGAIRDPLSGRSYVYQAMRVTGAGDVTAKVSDTLPGKLPQRVISKTAAKGYSSYGNEIGLATGLVNEIYDEGYVAKRLEIGAVVGAVKADHVVRERPAPGDIIILVGGATGRDGCGGATGSSKAHNTKSIDTCGAEVQKGNPTVERKLQRLFSNKECALMIKRCNDFGAGGVSVAVGELADGLDIDLDAVPVKYMGINGTELAISESQERMAVVVAPENEARFIELSAEENLLAVRVAVVKEERRMRMTWRGDVIADISRDFLDTNGSVQNADIHVSAPKGESAFHHVIAKGSNFIEKTISNLKDLNVCSQRGLSERFDSTIGAATVLMPWGGEKMITPQQVMCAKLPVHEKDTDTATVMSYGYSPVMGRYSPYHMGMYSVIEAASKCVCVGVPYNGLRMSFQEYFEKLYKEPARWGKPFSALLGSLKAQRELCIPSIGGKDSMSGSFEDISVPPTLVAFALGVTKASEVVPQCFDKANASIYLLPIRTLQNNIPDFDYLKKLYDAVVEGLKSKKIYSAYTAGAGGVHSAVCKAVFGSDLGVEFTAEDEVLFTERYGDIVILAEDADFLDDFDVIGVGRTITDAVIARNGEEISLDEAVGAWEETLSKVFPIYGDNNVQDEANIPTPAIAKRPISRGTPSIVRPKVFIPVFPGTNCELDSAAAFERAGADVTLQVFRNLSAQDVAESLEALANNISKCNILMVPGGFSALDEPEGSGKFIAAALRSPACADALNELLKNRDGLALGICNGFQALIKLGLFSEEGGVSPIEVTSPTLTFNTIGRHISCAVFTRIATVNTPWFTHVNVGDVHTIAVSHGEGRLVAPRDVLNTLVANGQVATQYVNTQGAPTYDPRYNPNDSMYAIEGLISRDGRVLGKMGHSERAGENVMKNVPGNRDQMLFKSGVDYFK